MNIRIGFSVAALVMLAQATVYALPDPVDDLQATVDHSQVFLRWSETGASGVTYKIYHSTAGPITSVTGMTAVGSASYQSGRNERLIDVGPVAAPDGFVVPGGPATGLASGTGLFVLTLSSGGTHYIAITTVESGSENTAITAGANTVSTTNSLAIPQPYVQYSYVSGGNTIKVYTQFVGNVSLTAGGYSYPAMANVPCMPFGFALVYPTGKGPGSGTGVHPVVVKLHAGGGNFLNDVHEAIPQNAATSEYAWKLSLDDWLPAADGRTAWFGYHQGYDIFAASPLSNVPPTTGSVPAYTMHRIMHTLDWLIHKYEGGADAVNEAKVYLEGSSMGGAGSFMAAMLYPHRFAAAQLKVPKIDFSNYQDPITGYDFRTGGGKRVESNRRWGQWDDGATVNLATDIANPNDPSENLLMYDLSNGGSMAKLNANRSLPIIFALSGRQDNSVGWQEKIACYDSLQIYRHGGFYFWDDRTHTGEGAWGTIWKPDFLRYSTALSYPAFSNCNVDDDPGIVQIWDNAAHRWELADGSPDGDLVGTINGYLDWDDAITDNSTVWKCVLKRNTTIADTMGLSPTARIRTDVTLRRLQNFHPIAGMPLEWKVYSIATGALLQSGSFSYDPDEPITVPGVKVKNTGVRLEVRIATIPGDAGEIGPGLE